MKTHVKKYVINNYIKENHAINPYHNYTHTHIHISIYIHIRIICICIHTHMTKIEIHKSMFTHVLMSTVC